MADTCRNRKVVDHSFDPGNFRSGWKNALKTALDTTNNSISRTSYQQVLCSNKALSLRTVMNAKVLASKAVDDPSCMFPLLGVCFVFTVMTVCCGNCTLSSTNLGRKAAQLSVSQGNNNQAEAMFMWNPEKDPSRHHAFTAVSILNTTPFYFQDTFECEYSS